VQTYLYSRRVRVLYRVALVGQRAVTIPQREDLVRNEGETRARLTTAARLVPINAQFAADHGPRLCSSTYFR
jgi:hypothetical protein